MGPNGPCRTSIRRRVDGQVIPSRPITQRSTKLFANSGKKKRVCVNAFLEGPERGNPVY